jgi:hypothetical protein
VAPFYLLIFKSVFLPRRRGVYGSATPQEKTGLLEDFISMRFIQRTPRLRGEKQKIELPNNLKKSRSLSRAIFLIL